MKAEELKPKTKVCHTKHNRNYVIFSVSAKYKDSTKGWVDGVIYAPQYNNDTSFFCRDKESFLEEFEVTK